MQRMARTAAGSRFPTIAAIKIQYDYRRKFSGALKTGKASREAKQLNGDFPNSKYQSTVPLLLASN